MELPTKIGMTLSHMQQLFAPAYLLVLNAIQAAIRAGSSAHAAARTAPNDEK